MRKSWRNEPLEFKDGVPVYHPGYPSSEIRKFFAWFMEQARQNPGKWQKAQSQGDHYYILWMGKLLLVDDTSRLGWGIYDIDHGKKKQNYPHYPSLEALCKAQGFPLPE